MIFRMTSSSELTCSDFIWRYRFSFWNKLLAGFTSLVKIDIVRTILDELNTVNGGLKVSNSGGIKLSTCQSLGLKTRGHVDDRCGGVPHVERFIQQKLVTIQPYPLNHYEFRPQSKFIPEWMDALQRHLELHRSQRWSSFWP